MYSYSELANGAQRPLGSVAGSVGRYWAPLRVGGNSVLGSVAGSVENDQKKQSERVSELAKVS